MKWRQSLLLSLTGLCALTHCLPLQYHFISTRLPWLKAQMYCREQYTDLATVFDIEDMNRLVNTAQDSTGGFTEKAWIGLHDNLTSWRWSFSDSGYYRDKEGDYRNWYFGQPDNFLGDQMCVKMWGGGVWEDSSCFLRNPFICYDGTSSTNEPFVLVEQDMSWRDAQLYCRKHYTDLASVRNQEENQEIQLLTRNGGVWIGLYRTRLWSDHSQSTYRHWKAGQPDNVGGRQSCVATDLGDAGLWSDEQCDRELAFICYGENNETPEKTVLSTTTTTVTPVTPVTPVTSTNTSSMSPNKTTSTETESAAGHVSAEFSEQPFTSKGTSSSEQPVTEHVIKLRVTFTSKIQLSQDGIKELVSVEFHNLLTEMGLPASIKVSVKRPVK